MSCWKVIGGIILVLGTGCQVSWVHQYEQYNDFFVDRNNDGVSISIYEDSWSPEAQASLAYGSTPPADGEGVPLAFEKQKYKLYRTISLNFDEVPPPFVVAVSYRATTNGPTCKRYVYVDRLGRFTLVVK